MPLKTPASNDHSIRWTEPASGSQINLIRSTGTWSLVGWLKPEAGTANRMILHAGDLDDLNYMGVRIGTSSSHADIAAILYDSTNTSLGTSGTNATAGAVRPIDVTSSDNWILVCLSHVNASPTSSSYRIRCVGHNGTVYNGGAITYDPSANAITLPDFIQLAKSTASAVQSFRGEYGPWQLRNHEITNTDLLAAYNTAKLTGFMVLDSGNFNGEAGQLWGIGHACTPEPDLQGSGSVAESGTPAYAPSSVTAVSASNLCVFDKNSSSLWNGSGKTYSTASYFDVYPADVTVDGSWTFTAVDAARFPLTQTFPAGPAGVSVGNGEDWPLSYAFFAGELPDDVVRGIVSSNSRGCRYEGNRVADTDWSGGLDSHGFLPQHWACGFWQARKAVIGGTFCVPPTTSTGKAAFGFSSESAGRWTSGSVSSAPDTSGYRRYGWGSNLDTGGPGTAILLGNGAAYQTLTTQVLNSQYLWTNPRDYTFVFLKYPGSAPVTLTLRSSNTSRNDSTATSRDSIGPITLDTQRGSGAVVAIDTDGLVIELATLGGPGTYPRVGDALYLTDGTNTDVCHVIDMEVAGGGTGRIVTLEHAVRSAVNKTNLVGQTARWGEWGLERVTVSATGEEAWASDDYHGMRATAGSGDAPVALLMEEWGATSPCYWIAAAGWGGNGYDLQQAAWFTEGPRATDSMTPVMGLIEALDADLWMIVPAEQSSTPDSMVEIKDLVLSVSPDAEVGMIAGCHHAVSSNPGTNNGLRNAEYEDWVEYMEDNAEAEGMYALVLPFVALGDAHEQLPRGWRSDANHLSSEGAYIWALAAIADGEETLEPDDDPDPDPDPDPETVGYFDRNRPTGLRRLTYR